MELVTLKKMLYKLRARTKTILEFKLQEDHALAISFAAFLGMLNQLYHTGLEYFFLQKTKVDAREATFGRNLAVLYKKYNEEHKNNFSQELNTHGYPDNGNNQFSDLLPYKDWIKVAGADLAQTKFVQEVSKEYF